MKAELHDRYILYADDDFEDRELLIEIVNELDAEIGLVCVNDGEEMLDFLNSLPQGSSLPCLVLLDMKMPKMNGLQSLKNLKGEDRYNSIPTIMFSTSDTHNEIKQALDNGADGYIKKPVTRNNLKQVALQFIDHCNPPDKKAE